MKRTLLTLLTALTWGWATAQEPSLVNSDGSSITDKAAFLRGAAVNGFPSEASIPKKLHRLTAVLSRQNDNGGAGFSWPNRIRALTLGDSVACDIGPELHGIFGFGGGDSLLYTWTKQAAPTPLDTPGSNFGAWSAGVFTRGDQFSRVMNGTIVHLDASFATGTWVERTNLIAPFNMVMVGYLSANGYGSWKLQYKANGAGAWVDATTATVTAGGGSVSSGVINANNGGAEVYATARIALPAADVYHLRLIATSGRAYLSSAIVSNGAFGAGAAAGRNQYTGALSANMAAAGRQLEQHFAQTPQAVVTATISQIDPQIIVYKSLNGYQLASYQANWPGYAAKLQTAAPNATLVVVGSHPTNAAPTQADADMVAVDDYLREWCASQNGAVFVDARQSFPAFDPAYFSITSSADDLWSDNIHIDDLFSNAGGEVWVRALVLDALRPALQHAIERRGPWAVSRVIPMPETELRLYDGATKTEIAAGLRQRLVLGTHPRFPAYQVIRPSSAPYNSGTGAFNNETGWGALAITDTNPGALVLLNNGSEAMVWGNFSNGTPLGFTVGVANATTTNTARTKDGYRFRVPAQAGGLYSGLIVEGRTDSNAATRLLGININSTDGSEGQWLHAWYPDGSRKYFGTVADAHETTFVTGEPTADTTITTPVSQSGTVCIFLGILADPPAGTIPAGAIYVDNSATGNAVGTWLYSGSAWTQLN